MYLEARVVSDEKVGGKYQWDPNQLIKNGYVLHNSLRHSLFLSQNFNIGDEVELSFTISPDIENIKDIYLYDLKLKNNNPAQCIVCDNENEYFYVTQPIYNENSTTESLSISRLSFNGFVLDITRKEDRDKLTLGVS